MIEIYKTNENDDGRFRRPDDENAWFENDSEDFDDDEFGYFGIVVKKPTVRSGSYDENGNYVPRGLRR